jgi:CRISPR/Cas system-associated exonuclease Cas4 (RecB family)
MEIFESLKGVKRRGVWYAVWNNKTLDVGPREDVDMMRLYRVMLEIERAVEQDVHVPDISGKSCLWCSYTNLCAVTIPLSNEVENARAERLR